MTSKFRSQPQASRSGISPCLRELVCDMDIRMCRKKRVHWKTGKLESRSLEERKHVLLERWACHEALVPGVNGGELRGRKLWEAKAVVSEQPVRLNSRGHVGHGESVPEHEGAAVEML